MNRYRAGAVAWLASAVLFPVQLLVALRWPQGYSVRDNAISDLGVTVCGGFSEQGQQVREVCSPWHQLFNAGMVVSGVLIVIGALLLHGWWDSRSGRTGTSVIALTGLSVSIVGLAPWDTHPGVHDFAALGQAVTQWLAMGLLAVAAGRGHFRRLIIEVHWVGFGGAERLSFDTLSLWTALVGATLLRRRGHRGQATGPAKSPTIRTR